VSYVRLNPQRGAPVDELEPVDVAAQEAEIERRVQQEVARLRRQAEIEGRAAGEAAGRAKMEALAATALGPAETALREAWSQLAAPLAQQQIELATLVTDLAFSLCRHVIGVEVQANPEGLIKLVTRLIKEAAAERSPRQSLLVRVNPADHELLQTVISLNQAHLLSDAAVSRGGAMVEIIAPEGDPVDKIEWDATIETRLTAVQEALGIPPAPAEAAA